MNTGARRSFAGNSSSQRHFVTGNGGSQVQEMVSEAKVRTASPAERVRVLVRAENRMLREALTHMLSKHIRIEVHALEGNGGDPLTHATGYAPEILLISSRCNLAEDLERIQTARSKWPKLRILLLGMNGDEKEFLQCVRAGVNGYLPQDASGEEVVKAILALASGEAVCRGSHCGALFRYFERAASALPSGAVRQKLRLTRREQQLIPLIAQGLTNKEIANHFSLSEQTIKNHLHRMKVKIGAGDRLDIVQLYRVQEFLV